MIRRLLARLARMNGAEVAWRGAAAARTIVDRSRARFVRPGWNRDDLLAAPGGPGNGRRPARGPRRPVEPAVGRGAPRARRSLRARAAALRDRPVEHGRGASPASGQSSPTPRVMPPRAPTAFSRASTICSGIAGCDSRPHLPYLPAPGLPDWHLDPVHGRRPPVTFWSTVPYLAAGMRRSQDHLGAESASALARARPRVLADRRREVSRSLRRGAGEAGSTRTRRSPASTGRACSSSRSDRSRGSGRFTSSPHDAAQPNDGRGAVDRRSAARARSPADARRAEPVVLLQPEHAPARRSAGALRRGRALPELAASARGARRSAAASCSPRSTGRSPPTAATASAPRTTTATRSTSTLLALADRAHHGDDRPIGRFERRGRKAGVGGAAARRRQRPRAAHRRRRWRRAAADDRPRAGRSARQPRGRGRARRSPGPADRPRARRSGVDARPAIRDCRNLAIRSAIRNRAVRTSASRGSARHRLLRVALARRATIWSSTADRTATRTAATRTPTRCR